MKVIWKRPDGFLGAQPQDFRVLTIGNEANIWLHKTDRETFPFRVSGGWEEEEQTRRLNSLIHIIGESSQVWLEHLNGLYDHAMSDEPKSWYQDLRKWVSELDSGVKGDTWEVDIMRKVLDALGEHIVAIEAEFVGADR